MTDPTIENLQAIADLLHYARAALTVGSPVVVAPLLKDCIERLEAMGITPYDPHTTNSFNTAP